MKRLTVNIVLALLITQSGIAEAGYLLKVNFTQDARAYEKRELRSNIFPVGTEEALAEKKKMFAYLKANKGEINKIIIDMCKKDYFYNSRIKVKDARGGTAGLGNLKTLKVENVKVLEEVVSYDMNMSLEEFEKIEEEYPDITTWPGWIEDGYAIYGIDGVCRFSGTISIVSSVAYEVFIKEYQYGEYSRSELMKKKWILNYESPD